MSLLKIFRNKEGQQQQYDLLRMLVILAVLVFILCVIGYVVYKGMKPNIANIFKRWW